MFHFSDTLVILALLLFMSSVHCLQGSLSIRWGARVDTLTSRNAFSNLPYQKPFATTSSLARLLHLPTRGTSLHRTGFAGVQLYKLYLCTQYYNYSGVILRWRTSMEAFLWAKFNGIIERLSRTYITMGRYLHFIQCKTIELSLPLYLLSILFFR